MSGTFKPVALATQSASACVCAYTHSVGALLLQAAEVLSDPSKKRQYDAEQAAAAYKHSQPAAPPRRPQE